LKRNALPGSAQTTFNLAEVRENCSDALSNEPPFVEAAQSHPNMTPPSEVIFNFHEYWQRWQAQHNLPFASATDLNEHSLTWRHPALPGVFSSNWRFKRWEQLSELPPAISWTRDPSCLANQYTCIVSSRVGRKIDAIPNWVSALRTVVCKAYRDREAIATASGTATHPFVQRLASLLHIPRVVLKPFELHKSELFSEKFTPSDPQEIEVYYSFLPQRAGEKEPAIDSWLIGLADQVRVLAVNSKRNTYRSTFDRLKRERQRGDVWILHDDLLSTPSLRRELLEHGAVDWLLSAEDLKVKQMPVRQFVAASSRRDLGDFLAHCTRAPILEVDEAGALDEIDRLLFRQNIEEAGPLTSLIRILTSARLQANRDLLRGGEPMVCWTAQTVSRLSELRTYRKHLARWDFEPFGIAVKRDRLIQLGARQVRYGTADEFTMLANSDRSFFQLAASEIGGQHVDWKREQEWRLPGDLHLAKLGIDEAFVFVPDQQSAEVVAPYSRWPVLIDQ
jgi:hypothetical protein